MVLPAIVPLFVRSPNGCSLAEPEQRRERTVFDVGWVCRICSVLGRISSSMLSRPVSIEVARRSRHSRLASRRTNSRSTADFGVVIRSNSLLEGLVVLGIFERLDDGLGGQSMANGISRALLFAIFGPGTRAFERVAAIGFDLFKRRHGGPAAELGSFRNWYPLGWPAERRRICRSPLQQGRALRHPDLLILPTLGPDGLWSKVCRQCSSAGCRIAPTSGFHCRSDAGRDDGSGRAAP